MFNYNQVTNTRGSAKLRIIGENPHAQKSPQLTVEKKSVNATSNAAEKEFKVCMK
jgi:hypothetical protein